MDAEWDGSDSAFKTCPDVVSSLYETSYLKSFLPVYQMVNQSSNVSSICDRFKAIRFAADAALAVTASGTFWSEALSKKLEDACGERGMSGHLDEARLCTSPETGTTSPSLTTEPASPGSTRTSSIRDERSILGRRRGLRADSVLLRRGVIQSFALRSLMMGRSNWYRSQLCSRAILRKLSLRAKSKYRSFRRCWKAKKSLRKVKSLAKSRSRASSQRPVTALDPRVEERSFDNRLVALQQLIPGGDNMDATVLLDEAADFVMFLKMQVQALQSVCNAVEMREQLDELVPEL